MSDNTKNLKASEAGSALLEMVAMMPIYLLLLFGIYYFGNIGMVKMSSEESTYYYAQSEGIETEGDADAKFFYEHEGKINIFSDEDSGGLNYDQQYVYDSLNVAALEARTYYRINENGEMEPVTTVSYVLPVNYSVFDMARDDSYIISDQLNEWYSRSESNVEFRFDPKFIALKDMQLSSEDAKDEKYYYYKEGEKKLIDDQLSSVDVKRRFWGAHKNTDSQRSLTGTSGHAVMDFVNEFFGDADQMPEILGEEVTGAYWQPK